MRFRGVGRAAVALSAVLSTVLAVLPAVPARGDETTIGYGPLRRNWDANEPGLSVSAVSQPDFGQLWSTTLPRPPGQNAVTYPNQMYAQPLVADGHVIVATEENQVDALDPKTGAVQWSVTLGPAWAPTLSCGDLTPRIGITSTPVYDPATKTVYLVAKTDDGPDPDHPHMRMYALSVTTGKTRAGWPLDLTGKATNSGVPFNPMTANQRTGLLLMDGAVYFATASHCDRGPYVGFVGRVSTSSQHLTLWSAESNGAADQAGIWQSGAGLVSDGPGRIFLATGNGVSPPPGPGSKPPGTLAESVVRLAVGTNGVMTAKDFFSPANNDQLDQEDADLGSGAPTPLPKSWGSTAHPRLLVMTGKDGIVRLLDRDALGGMGQGPNGTDKVVSAQTLKGVWGRPAIFSSGSDHFIYLLPSTSPLQALRVAPNGAGVPTLSLIGASVDSYGYTSGSPIVTSDGTAKGTAVVWVVTVSGSSGSSAMLRAFPAVPPAGGNWHPIASFPLGLAAKFIQPATDEGRVFVGTRDGRVLAFGRPTTAVISSPPTDFDLVPVGGQTTKTVTITANDAVTINSLETSAPFTTGQISPGLPHALSAGQTVTVQVTFAPTTPDTSTGELIVHTQTPTGALSDYTFALTGTGTQDGLAASPSPVDFGTVTIGKARQLGITIRNTGTTSITITGTTPPSAPFVPVSLPANGATLPTQQSVTATVRFEPTAAGSVPGSFTLNWSAGSTNGSLTVPLVGVGTAGAPLMSVNDSLDFGNVPPGETRSLDLVITNVGTATMTINKAAVPTAPFVVPTPLSEGQTLDPGASITVTVKLAPRDAQPVSGSYSITADDGQGAVDVPLTANRAPWTGPVHSPYGCIDIYANQHADGTVADLWTCNGSPAQQFTFGAGSTLRAGPRTSPWCLGAKGNRTRPGTAVMLYACSGSAGQVFRWAPTSQLRNPVSGLCLQPVGGSSAQGARLELAKCGSADYQKWDASGLVSTRGEMSSGLAAAHQLCLTDPGALTMPGTLLEIDPCRTTASQIVTTRDDRLRVAAQCVTSSRARKAATATISLRPCNGAVTQVFLPKRGSRLVNPRTGLCLTVRGSSSAPGTRIKLSPCADVAAQRWRLPG